MQINRNNYEAFFLDFWENSLGAEERIALSLFLEFNPDLQDEFLDFREALEIKLNAKGKVEYPTKQMLKKTVVIPTKNINQDNYEDYIIAQIENDLDPDQKLELKRFKDVNLQLLPEFELYTRTVLVPDRRIVFENKQALNRQTKPGKLVRIFVVSSAIAAMLLMAYVLVKPFQDQTSIGGMAAMVSNRLIPDKPLPRLIPGEFDELVTDQFDGQDLKVSRSIDEKGVISYAEVSTGEVTGSDNPKIANDHAEREMAHITTLSRSFDQPVLAVVPIRKIEIEPRTEMDGVFEFLMLREEMLVEHDRKKPGAFQRILKNLGNVVFGGSDVEEQSFLGQIAENGREKINEIKDEGPKIKTVESEESKMTYFAINENFRIRISKSNKSDNQPNLNQE